MEAYHFVYFLALSSCLWMVARYGKSDERGALIAVIVASIITPFSQAHHFEQPEVGIYVVDLLTLLFFVFLALRSSRYWPLFATGFQLAGMAVHIVPYMHGRYSALAYGVGSVAAAYLVLLAIALGSRIEAVHRT